MPRNKHISRRFGIAIGAASALLFGAYGVAQAFLNGLTRSSTIEYAAALACFGFLFGVVFAFDTEPGDSHENRPVLRTALSAVAGTAFRWVLSFPGEGIAFSAVVGAILGYTGLLWARYF